MQQIARPRPNCAHMTAGTQPANGAVMRHLLVLTLVPTLIACGPDLVASDGESGDSETGDSETGGEPQWEDGRTLVEVWQPESRPRVDMIIVVDDSPSMRAHMPTMAANAHAFGGVLAAEDLHADARIIVTTTSVPGPTCTGPRARGGESMLDSCLAHLEDFIGLDEHGELGATVEDLAMLCESQCMLPSIDRVPSRGFEREPELAVRPWIEAPFNSAGGNLADDVPFEDALACALLQGFSGCRFESPIEAAARVLERVYDPSDELYGFRRDDAALVVTIISDEDDCSHADPNATIFDPAGERVFWPAGASEPLSAICVNAGLACDENGCSLTDHDLSGAPTQDPTQAVLTGPARLLDVLTAAGEFDQDPWRPIVGVVGGFSSQGTVHYGQPEPGSPDEDYAAAFGIGPGCAASNQVRATPGGRLAALTDQVTPGNNFSICDDNWTTVFEPFARHGGPQLQPRCYPDTCIADLEPDPDIFEPDCVLERVDTNDALEPVIVPISTCERDANGWVLDEGSYNFTIPDGQSFCWAWLTDTNGTTANPYDDMSPECVESERPAEYKLAARPGSLIPYDSYYQLRCRPCE